MEVVQDQTMSKNKVKILSVEKSRYCIFCKRDTDDKINLGGLKMINGIYTHYYCLLLSSTVLQSGKGDEGILGFMANDILAEFHRSNNQICYICNRFGATLKCCNRNCSRKFHLPCGLMKKTRQNFLTLMSYCHDHLKPSSNIPRRLKKKIWKLNCVICQAQFDKHAETDIVWANCCKKNTILHIHCVKKMALSAGLYTTCPVCNNLAEFRKTMQQYGVFIPDSDATWKFWGNVDSVQLYKHQRCEVKNCLSPRGRQFSESHGQWRITLCCLCASYGAHWFCYKVKKFTCPTCNEVDRRISPRNIIQSNVSDAAENSNAASEPLTDNVITTNYRLMENIPETDNKCDIVNVDTYTDVDENVTNDTNENSQSLGSNIGYNLTNNLGPTTIKNIKKTVQYCGIDLRESGEDDDNFNNCNIIDFKPGDSKLEHTKHSSSENQIELVPNRSPNTRKFFKRTRHGQYSKRSHSTMMQDYSDETKSEDHVAKRKNMQHFKQENGTEQTDLFRGELNRDNNTDSLSGPDGNVINPNFEKSILNKDGKQCSRLPFKLVRKVIRVVSQQQERVETYPDFDSNCEIEFCTETEPQTRQKVVPSANNSDGVVQIVLVDDEDDDADVCEDLHWDGTDQNTKDANDNHGESDRSRIFVVSTNALKKHGFALLRLSNNRICKAE